MRYVCVCDRYTSEPEHFDSVDDFIEFLEGEGWDINDLEPRGRRGSTYFHLVDSATGDAVLITESDYHDWD